MGPRPIAGVAGGRCDSDMPRATRNSHWEAKPKVGRGIPGMMKSGLEIFSRFVIEFVPRELL